MPTTASRNGPSAAAPGRTSPLFLAGRHRYVGLTGVETGNTVSLYATTGTMRRKSVRVANNSLISDFFTYNSGDSGTGTFGSPVTLATAGTDDTFAGVAFAPQAADDHPVVTIRRKHHGRLAADHHRHGQVRLGPDVGQIGYLLHGHGRFSSSDPNAGISR